MPEIGKWTAEDPIGFLSGGFNDYAYVSNDPVNYIDLSGLEEIGVGSKGGANIGTKLEYVFGKATGRAHNIERSTGMLRQLERIGIFDNAAGRTLMNNHLENVYSGTKGILQPSGNFLRESLLMGPNGGIGVQSIWEGNRLISVILLGGR